MSLSRRFSMYDFSGFKDEELLLKTDSLIKTERRGHAESLAALREVDVRKLYLREAYSSLFAFCTKRLGLSESSAAKRTQVARLSARFPVVLEFISRAELTMANASVLAPHLTVENHLRLLQEASGKTRSEVEKLVAVHFPEPDIKESLRRLPEPKVTFPGEGKVEPTPPPVTPRPPRPERVEPLSARRTKFEFSGDDELVAMYRTLQDRLRRKFPKGRMEDLVREAFTLLLEKTDPAREPKRKVTPKPSKHTRTAPKPVARQVFKRDGSQCTYVSPGGTRCDAKAFLELDHIIPWSLGGSSRDPNNLTLRCRPHNAWRGGARPATSPPAEPRLRP
jgi:5-methylcytosine-specific restriction endonuclease McrA